MFLRGRIELLRGAEHRRLAARLFVPAAVGTQARALDARAVPSRCASSSKAHGGIQGTVESRAMMGRTAPTPAPQSCAAALTAGGTRRQAIVVAGDARVLCENCMSDDLLHSLRSLRVLRHLLVYAFDDASQAYAQRVEGVDHVQLWRVGSFATALNGSDDRYHRWKMSMQKALIISSVLECGVNALMTDIDVYFMASPFDYMPESGVEFDVAVMTDAVQEHTAGGISRPARAATQTAFEDQRDTDTGDEEAERRNFTFGLDPKKYTFIVWENMRLLYNSGFFYVRASEHTVRAFRSWDEHCRSVKVWDQAAFNDLFAPLGTQWGFGLRAYLLNPYVAANSMFYRTRVRRQSYRPMVVHANYEKPHQKRPFLRHACRLEAQRPPPPLGIESQPSASWNWNQALALGSRSNATPPHAASVICPSTCRFINKGGSVSYGQCPSQCEGGKCPSWP